MKPPHIQRLEFERMRLVERIDSLDALLASLDQPNPPVTVDPDERRRMERQRLHMAGYLVALNDRLIAAGVQP